MALEIDALYRLYKKARAVTTDTRHIAPGAIFFALKGERFDANTFAAEALARGASAAVVDDKKVVTNERFILVDDVLRTLQSLARRHREQLDIPVIGLTGSNGKTTSKELVREVLSAKYDVLATQGNLNNHIGVPLTLLSITPAHQIAVIEMGANHVGEIAFLCSIANPTHGFITNIGKAHIGMFGSYENILRAKSELYQHLIDHEGTVWINSKDPVLAAMARRFTKPLFYPAEGNDYHCEFVAADPFLRLRAENGEEVSTRLIGRYNFDNVAVALAVGKSFGVPADKANRAVATFAPGNMRSQIVSKGSNTIILDAYNANPASMSVAIESLAGMKASRKVLILGDMFELGAESANEHRALGTKIASFGLDEVYLAGPEMRAAAAVLPRAYYFEDTRQLVRYLKEHPVGEATILVKASRGMAFENVMESL